jgi:hypothetical protein
VKSLNLNLPLTETLRRVGGKNVEEISTISYVTPNEDVHHQVNFFNFMFLKNSKLFYFSDNLECCGAKKIGKHSFTYMDHIVFGFECHYW